MGLDLTFSTTAMSQYGHCGPSRTQFTRLHLPSSTTGEPKEGAEATVGYVRYPLGDRYLKIQGIPAGGSDYALQFDTTQRELSKAEIRERLIASYRRLIPAGTQISDEAIEAGANSSALLLLDGPRTEPVKVSEHHFVRWVSREEFEGLAQEVRDNYDEDSFWGTSLWDDLSNVAQKRMCARCDLNVELTPNRLTQIFIDRVDNRTDEEQKQILSELVVALVRSRGDLAVFLNEGEAVPNPEQQKVFLEFLSFELSRFPELQSDLEIVQELLKKREDTVPSFPGCRLGSMYAHWAGLGDCVKQFADFPGLANFQRSEGEVSTEALEAFSKELPIIRSILETNMVPAMSWFDREGKKLGTYGYDIGWLCGDEHRGYGMGIENPEQDFISVVFRSPGLFDVPFEQRNAALAKEGFDGLGKLLAEQRDDTPRLKFVEIRRENGSFVGVTRSGLLVDLPAVHVSEDGRLSNSGKDKRFTPFTGLPNEEQISCLKFDQSPAMNSFGYLLRALERFTEFGLRYQIPVRLG